MFKFDPMKSKKQGMREYIITLKDRFCCPGLAEDVFKVKSTMVNEVVQKLIEKNLVTRSGIGPSNGKTVAYYEVSKLGRLYANGDIEEPEKCKAKQDIAMDEFNYTKPHSQRVEFLGWCTACRG